MINKFCFWILPFLFTAGAVTAVTDNPTGKGATLSHLFAEKVYLHLDRHYYTSGEDIWFKAYLVNARNNKLSVNSSRTLYVELISPQSTIIGREILRINEGTTSGEFKLKDTIPGGKYRIRAYTKWMLNFGDDFVFERDIEVRSLSPLKAKENKPNVLNQVNIQFFPESGAMIDQIPAIVAFKATDVLGNSCNVTGSIVSSAGDTVSNFASLYLGMGKFSLLPQPGVSYYAVGKSKNIPFRIPLPVALSGGLSMRVVNGDSIVTIAIHTNASGLNEYGNKNLTLSFSHLGTSFYKQNIVLNSESKTIKVSKLNLPEGITQITLLDDALRPHCERLVYIERKHDNTKVSVLADKPFYKAREAVSLKIRVTDPQNQPIKTNLSLAVVDAGMVPNNFFNIRSYLMLESEIRGNVEQPMVYFDTANIARFHQVDLLLLTQGWRDYIWRHAADSLINPRFIAEQGLAVTGYVRRKLVKSPVRNVNVSMLMPEGQKEIFRVGKTDSVGKFDLGEIEFYGQRPIILSSKTKNHEESGMIMLDSLYLRSMNYPAKVRVQQQIDSLATAQKFWEEAFKKHMELKKYRLSDTILLNEVTVSANSNAGKNGKLQKSFQIQSSDSSYRDLDWYLSVNYPHYRNPRIHKKINFIGLGIRPGAAGEMFDVKSLSMDQVTKIDIYRGWNAMNYDSTMLEVDEETGSATAQLTKPDADDIYYFDIYVKPTAFSPRSFSNINSTVNGYYRARLFYSPIHKNPRDEARGGDLRTTIFWDPNIITNEEGEAEVHFYNSDQTTRIRASVEGLTDSGIPVTGEGGYEVKGFR